MSISRKRKSAVRDRLETKKTQRKTALIPFLTIGWPDDETFLRLATVTLRYTDVLGLRMPFGDGMAHGTLVQQTFREALQRGMDFARGLDLARTVTGQTDVPVVLECYYNPLLAGGLSPRCERIANAGIKALLVADLPPEEAFRLEAAATRNDLDLIYQCSPTSSRSRIQLVCLHSRGFLYCRAANDSAWREATEQDKAERLAKFISEVRRFTVLPIALDMGMDSASQAQQVGRMADACILGGGLTKAVREAQVDERVGAAARFLSDIREGLDGRA